MPFRNFLFVHVLIESSSKVISVSFSQAFQRFHSLEINALAMIEIYVTLLNIFFDFYWYKNVFVSLNFFFLNLHSISAISAVFSNIYRLSLFYYSY